MNQEGLFITKILVKNQPWR